jgi:hypothetical protein
MKFLDSIRGQHKFFSKLIYIYQITILPIETTKETYNTTVRPLGRIVYRKRHIIF